MLIGPKSLIKVVSSLILDLIVINFDYADFAYYNIYRPAKSMFY
jgi:hypothetical protein